MTKPTWEKRAWEKRARQATALVGAAVINSHLEAVRMALVAFDMSWTEDGFAERWAKELHKVDARQRTNAMAAERGGKAKR